MRTSRVVRSIGATRACLALAAMAGAGALGAQPPAPPRPPLLDALVGEWRMLGTVRGDSVTYAARGEWVLQGRFLRLSLRDVATPSEYEAHVYLAPAGGERVVAHWLDNFGAGPSRTLGDGVARGDTLTLDFDYPDGPMHDVIVVAPTACRWALHIDARDGGAGPWRTFADYRAERPAGQPCEGNRPASAPPRP